ncbi:MAG: AbrB/MazE/SpoVT family DNA-binding domain-containing protein [Candidatus Aureabacteria bacterium]|nr:AbrB/MazE/SpoVT family DNA-binding domain-containing protein [Candidatus Auribacterota bacterium]
METSMVTTKGQIVIPSKIRHRHKIKKGTKVCFLENGNDIILRPVTDDYIEELKGSLKTGGRALKALLDEKRREREL